MIGYIPYWVDLCFWYPEPENMKQRVILPRASRGANKITEFRQSGEPWLTVLHIEDNPAYEPWLERIIVRFPDLRLVAAVNITLGVELARVLQPDVILMGINLPRVRRIKAIRILRGDTVTAFIPVIALGASVRSRNMAHGLEAGFFRCLTKPIRNDDLTELLSEAFEFSAMKRRALIGDKAPLV